MCVTNRKEVEINMLKQSTIDKRLQESKDVSVLVFPEQQGEINKNQEIVTNLHKAGNGTINKTW